MTFVTAKIVTHKSDKSQKKTASQSGNNNSLYFACFLLKRNKLKSNSANLHKKVKINIIFVNLCVKKWNFVSSQTGFKS